MTEELKNPDVRKVMIVDDQNIFANGLRTLLESLGNVKVACVVKSGTCVFQALKKHEPDVLFLDLELPGQSGLDVLPKIRKKFPHLYICMLTMHEELEFTRQAKQLGANAYLTKDASSIELKTVLWGEVTDPFILSKYITLKQQALENEEVILKQSIRFSRREREVIRLIVSGKTNGEISRTLFVSAETVKSHRKNIFRKLHINKSCELVKYAMQHNLM